MAGKGENDTPVQAYVPANIKLEVEIKLKTEGKTISDFIRDCFLQKYREIKKDKGRC